MAQANRKPRTSDDPSLQREVEALAKRGGLALMAEAVRKEGAKGSNDTVLAHIMPAQQRQLERQDGHPGRVNPKTKLKQHDTGDNDDNPSASSHDNDGPAGTSNDGGFSWSDPSTWGISFGPNQEKGDEKMSEFTTPGWMSEFNSWAGRNGFDASTNSWDASKMGAFTGVANTATGLSTEDSQGRFGYDVNNPVAVGPNGQVATQQQIDDARNENIAAALEAAGKDNAPVDPNDPDQAPTQLSEADQNQAALSQASQDALGHATQGNEGLGQGLDSVSPGDSHGVTDTQAANQTHQNVTNAQNTLSMWNAIGKGASLAGKAGVPGASLVGSAIGAGVAGAKAAGYDSVGNAWSNVSAGGQAPGPASASEGQGSSDSSATGLGAMDGSASNTSNGGGYAPAIATGGFGMPVTATNTIGAGDAYNWFKNLYSDQAAERARVSGAADTAQAAANSAGIFNLTNAGKDRQTYDTTFTPTLNKIVTDANTFDAKGEADRQAQEGEATVGKTFGQARGARTRQLESMGVNPNSTKFASGLAALDSDEAAARAVASNTGRVAGRELGTQKLVQAANLSSPLASQAITEGNAGVVASQAGLSAAQVPGAANRADAALVATGAGIDNASKQTDSAYQIGMINAATNASGTGASIAASQAKQQAAQDAQNNEYIKDIASNAGTIVNAGKTIWDWFSS
jgi:hypothetical protein